MLKLNLLCVLVLTILFKLNLLEMKIKNQLPLQRLIAKIDNDFNIDNSDWIPRVGAWVTDALSQMKILPMQCKTRKLDVIDRIALHPCIGNIKSIEVFDRTGNKINYLDNCSSGKCNNNKQDSISSTGEVIGIFNNNKDSAHSIDVATIVNANNRNFVISNDNQIELNFDTDYITVKTEEVATYFDDYFNCEVPYIYDNGMLLEALSWYCLFKMLSRGYKHQVYSLQQAQQQLNPYLQWMYYKPKAKISVLNDLSKHSDDNGWNNFFYNSTFRPRD
uniref:Uncharacterized protein n=1 Tax=Geladintestivirus 1 TaxID=3233133 RepID=A0AAU8MJW2_9CAUD